MEQSQRDVPRNGATTTNESSGKEFVQLINDMVAHEKAKDVELIRTLKEAIVYLRSEVINKQTTIDSLLKQLDRLTLAVNCNCQCVNMNVNNNGMTVISDITHFSDVSTHDEKENVGPTLDRGGEPKVDICETQPMISDLNEYEKRHISVDADDDVETVEMTPVDNRQTDVSRSDDEADTSRRSFVSSHGGENNVVRQRAPKPDEVFV